MLNLLVCAFKLTLKFIFLICLLFDIISILAFVAFQYIFYDLAVFKLNIDPLLEPVEFILVEGLGVGLSVAFLQHFNLGFQLLLSFNFLFESLFKLSDFSINSCVSMLSVRRQMKKTN